MARPKVNSINLTDEERSRLNKVIKSKTTCETVLKRCQILRILMNQKAANWHMPRLYIPMRFVPRLFQILSETMSIKGLTASSVIISAQTQRRPCVRQMDALKQNWYRLPAALPQTAIPGGRWNCWKKKSRVELETLISRGTIRRVLKKMNSGPTETTTGVSRQKKTPNS